MRGMTQERTTLTPLRSQQPNTTRSFEDDSDESRSTALTLMDVFWNRDVAGTESFRGARLSYLPTFLPRQRASLDFLSPPLQPPALANASIAEILQVALDTVDDTIVTATMNTDSNTNTNSVTSVNNNANDHIGDFRLPNSHHQQHAALLNRRSRNSNHQGNPPSQ